MDERNERSSDVSELVTKPSTNGEAPLARRVPRGLLPGTWLGHTVKIEYTGADGLAVATSGALLELMPFGPVLRSAGGDMFALSWDAVKLVELVEG